MWLMPHFALIALIIGVYSNPVHSPSEFTDVESRRKCSVYVTLCACSKSELGGGNVRKPQKYTYSQHGNKCFKEEIRSLSKVGFVSKDKASFVRKDTTGT